MLQKCWKVYVTAESKHYLHGNTRATAGMTAHGDDTASGFYVETGHLLVLDDCACAGMDVCICSLLPMPPLFLFFGLCSV